VSFQTIMNNPQADLATYLSTNYLTAEQFATHCQTSVDELDTCIAEQLIPQPSYVVTSDRRLLSAAFGEFVDVDALPGSYFHPGCASWTHQAIVAKNTFGARAARSQLEASFKQHFAEALAELDQTVFRLPDSFNASGEPVIAGLAARTESAWQAFLKGIFGLCVADPSTAQSIARKEILQEALSAYSDSEPDQPGKIRALIAEYAKAAMPFTPQEYPRSSRKRLVEDWLAKLDGVR
jgi:hypothetical protein